MEISAPYPDPVLIVASDGGIPADQLARLGLQPGDRLRVVAKNEGTSAATRLAGSLPDVPDISWHDFERATTGK